MNQSNLRYAVTSCERAFVLSIVNTVKHVVPLSMNVVNRVVKSADCMKYRLPLYLVVAVMIMHFTRACLT